MEIQTKITDVFDAGTTKQDSRMTESSLHKMRNAHDSPVKADAKENGHEPVTFKKAFDSASKETGKESAQSEQGHAGAGVRKMHGQSKQGREAKVASENSTARESVAAITQGKSNVSPEQMIAMLQASLAKISKELNLDINLNDIELGRLSDAVLNEFSEIMASLQGILQVLSGAVQQNVGLEIKGTMIEPEKAAELMKTLTVEMFQMQLAFESLGVAGTVARGAAEKMAMPMEDGGIPRAQNPETLSMPAEQLEQLFGDLLETSEEKLTSVVARIAAIAQERVVRPATEKVNDAAKQVVEGKADVQKDGMAKIAGAVVQKPAIQELPVECSSFDSQVLRRLLKLDTTEQQPQTGEQKPDTKESKPVVLTLGSNPSAVTSQNLQQIIDSSEQIAAVEASAKTQAQLSDVPSSRLLTLSQKVLEETVLNQVSQKLSTALKSGMHEIRMVLRPESLGEVRMTIKMDGDIVMARMYVENQQVKQIIESNLNHLRNALEEQNLQAGAFDVNVNQGDSQDEQGVFGEKRNAHNTMNGDEAINGLADEGTLSVGTETGRRFGTNSFEFFA